MVAAYSVQWKWFDGRHDTSCTAVLKAVLSESCGDV